MSDWREGERTYLDSVIDPLGSSQLTLKLGATTLATLLNELKL